jgi:hypothetical protein
MTITTPSLDATGLTVLRLAEIRENLRDRILGEAAFPDGTNVGDDSAMGQLLDAPAEELALVHELVEGVYNSFVMDAAEGVQLDNLGGLSGVVREPATYSTATVTCAGTPATVIAAGKRVRVTDAGIFALDDEVTIPGGGSIDVTVTAVESGPVEGLAGTIDEIVDPVSGWSTVTNAADAVLGSAVETDVIYRARINESFSIGGTGTDQAIKARIQALDDVDAAVVISNRTLITDSFGIPGKAFRAVVWPTSADGEQIAETIWSDGAMPAGIYSDGTQVFVITDSQGYAQTVRFSWATELQLYWDVTVTSNSDYPVDGDDLVAAAVLSYGNTLSVGDDALIVGAIADIMDAVPGVEDLLILVKVGGWPGGGDTSPISVDLDEIATSDSGRITVA